MLKRFLFKQLWRLWLGLLVGLLGPMPEGLAGGVGSPSSILKKGQWAFGASSSSVVERNVENSSGGSNAVAFGGNHFRGYGLTDRLSLYGSLGATRLKITDSPTKIDNSTEHSFSGAIMVSGQLKGRLWQRPEQDLVWDGSVRFLDLRSRHEGANEGDWLEWQFATTVAKRFGDLTPYAGFKLSLLDFDYTLRKAGALVEEATYEEDGVLGLVLGTDFAFGASKEFVLNVEGTFLNGVEIDVAVNYSF